MPSSTPVNSESTSTLCFCPMCEKTHKLFIFWTGIGIPRKYCLDCKNNNHVLRNSEDSAVILAGNSTMYSSHWKEEK